MDFTRISEQLSPEAVMQMLNTYLSVIADTVVEHSGIVNKFVGDNIMAVWERAPISTRSRTAGGKGCLGSTTETC